MKLKFNTVKKLTDTQLIEGIRYSLQNSNELYNSALILKDSNIFGTSISLLVLSIEESIKALSLFYILISKGDDEKEEFRKLFDTKDLHKSRHDFALIFNEFLKLFKPFELVNDNDEQIDVFMSRLICKIDEGKEVLYERISNEDNNKSGNWLLQANTDKNKGLYVGFDNKWLLPNKLTEQDFIKVYNESQFIRSHVSIILSIFVEKNDEDEILRIIEMFKPYSTLKF